MVEGASQVLDERPLDRQLLGGGRRQTVAAGDVDGEHLAAGALFGEPDGATDQRAALGAAGEAHDDALARACQIVGTRCSVPVLLQILVDAVGDPEQRQLAQSGEIAGAEVVGQGGVDLVRLVDVAVRHTAAQRLRRHVDQFDLVGPSDHLVGHGLPLAYSRYRLDDVAERFQVLDVDGGDDVDPGGKELLDVLPALGVARARHVRVCQLVHEGDGGPALEGRIEVHLGEDGVPVLDLAARELFQTVRA